MITATDNRKMQLTLCGLKSTRKKYPNYTREDVKKKINAYRTNYCKLKKKVQDLEKSGAGADQVYEPTLWYFQALTFLNDQEIPVKSRSTLTKQICQASNTDDSGPSHEVCNYGIILL